MSPKGTLYLLPSLMGENAGAEWLCQLQLRLFDELKIYFAENERTARRLLRRAGFKGDLHQIQIFRLDKNTPQQTLKEYLHWLNEGHHAGILSEAGMPALADPGAALIQMAHLHDIPVLALPGPSAIFMAIVSSGFNGQQFSFNGYLPIETQQRRNRIKQLEDLASKTKYAQYFIETPYRNNALLADLLSVCKPETMLSIAANLTEPEGWNKSKRIASWQKNPPDLHKIPVVFGIS
ncbi:MAG: SAM-dependent methyltransferase [Bacteroidia bacterium]|jgi:16S rRNA (cytidine1402-2'-O)-methyltransferase|nr:SAM-dependent methyltransferase [Bacteroidia bacterium]MCC6768764.1 SAM-dependent methyltransferase [Bacteroidia bacterium]